MAETPEVRKARSRKAILSRHRATDDPERLEATRDYAVLSLEQHIQTAVAKAPPFTEAQRDRLRALLAPSVKKYAFDIRTEPTAVRKPAA